MLFRSLKPFLNSWAQRLDSIIRAASGYGMSPEVAAKSRKLFVAHALAMAAMSAGISALLAEFSEDYRNANPDDWAGGHVMPIPEFFGAKEGRMSKGKGPFELNSLFWLLPEMAVRNYYGLDKTKDYSKIFARQAWRDLSPPGAEDPMGVMLFTPLMEAAIGSTLSLIDSRKLWDEHKIPALRGRGQSPIADALSFGNISPAQIRHIGQGYFGAVYSAVDSLAKGIASTFGSKTARADLRDLTEIGRAHV